jgi:PBP1b-binding outer membrane lipoprotein LpoB
MKQVALLLLAALMLNGCGSNPPTVQSTAGGVWQAELLGGSGDDSGYSFITEFTLNSDSTLSVSSFQFITENSADSGDKPCFPINGGTISGTIPLTVNSNDTVTGTITFVVRDTINGSTLTLDGTVTGTAIVGSQNSSATLTGATMSGNWTLTGGSGCDGAGGSFTMAQPTTPA